MRKAKAERAASREEQKRQALLEEVLRYVLPGKDSKKACAALLEVFGSFDGIFAAPEEVLQGVPELGKEGARFLHLLIELSRVYLEERAWNLQRVFDAESAVELFRPKFLGRKSEAACLMLLDGRGRVVYNDVIFEGSVSQVTLQLRRVLQLCIQYNAEDVFLAHNHPSGVAIPSPGDMIVTDRLMAGLESIGAHLCDHVILADENYYSFLESGVLREQEALYQAKQSEELEAVRDLAALAN